MFESKKLSSEKLKEETDEKTEIQQLCKSLAKILEFNEDFERVLKDSKFVMRSFFFSVVHLTFYRLQIDRKNRSKKEITIIVELFLRTQLTH